MANATHLPVCYQALRDYLGEHHPEHFRDLVTYGEKALLEAPEGTYDRYIACLDNNNSVTLHPQAEGPDALHYRLTHLCPTATLVCYNRGAITTCPAEYAYEFLCGGDFELRTIAASTSAEVTVSVPSYDELFGSLPWRLRRRLREARVPFGYGGTEEIAENRLKRAYDGELLSMLREARRCEKATIAMGLFHQSGRQWICHFSSKDMGLPQGDSYNFHGHNTSQWVQAGAIVVDDQTAEVTTHH